MLFMSLFEMTEKKKEGSLIS